MRGTKVDIREAVPEDNDKLQELQSTCPQGTNLIVSIVNTPDFFGRAKAYESYKVIVAYEDNRITGSAACAIRNAFVNGHPYQVGYEFQYFTSPDCRGKGVARQLHKQIEDYFMSQGVAISYLLVMEDNLPAMRLFEGQGFKRHRTLVMRGLAIYKEMKIGSYGKVRPMMPEDLPAASELINKTWRDYDLYGATSAEALAQFINRTPGYRLDNLVILENEGEIMGCLGFWDWNQVMRITVKARNLRMQITGLLVDIARNFRPMPRVPRPDESLNQWCLTPIAFKNLQCFVPLLNDVNNKALLRGIGQIFFVCERYHALLESLKGFIRVDTLMHLYLKTIQQGVLIESKPVFVDGIDL
jgi:GNAT superfamily N-acetyltransferase